MWPKPVWCPSWRIVPEHNCPFSAIWRSFALPCVGMHSRYVMKYGSSGVHGRRRFFPTLLIVVSFEVLSTLMPCWSLLVPIRIAAWNVVHVCTPTILNCCTWVHVDSLTRTCMPPLHMSFSDSFIFFCDSFIVIHRSLSLSLSLSLSVCLSVSLSLSLSLCLFSEFFLGV